MKQRKRRHSLEEDLFAICEEESQGEVYSVENGGVHHALNRRNSMVVLSEPPPLSRKQRKRHQRKQAQMIQHRNRQAHHSSNILSENGVQEIGNFPTYQTPHIAEANDSSHYHTIHSPPKQQSTELPWRQVKRSGSMDNLSSGGTKVYASQAAGRAGRNHYVQTEQNSRFVVQPVVNVYLNSQYSGDPLTTSNKYDLLNSSLHDDPTPFKERSLNYGLHASCEVVNPVIPTNKHKSKFNMCKKQLFSESYIDSNGGKDEDHVMTISTGCMADKTNRQLASKIKRSKSTSPKRVGKTAKQRVLFKHFNPDNADWIQKQ